MTKSHREQDLNYREGEELSWCPSWSNSLWQGWSCGLVHCPGGNVTDPIWRVLASSLGIYSWTPSKPQHSNPNPNPNLWPINSGVLTSLLLLQLSSSLTDSLASLNLLCHSKTDAWFLLHIVLLKCLHVQIAFLKFTSCDNQALVGCIPTAAVAVHKNWSVIS